MERRLSMDEALAEVSRQMGELAGLNTEDVHEQADELLIMLVTILANRLGLDVQAILEDYKRVPKWYA